MNNALKCQQLFSFESVFFKNLFSSFDYPWEIFMHLDNIFDNITKSGMLGFRKLREGVFVGDDIEISDSARIEGTAIIGSGCKLRHGAFLRGSVILGERCVVGNSSEVKASILMDGAQIPHFNYVGNSILGSKAHLGAGAVCSNLRSDKANVKLHMSDDTIDSGLKKLGAILGDNVEVGCGAVLCPGTVIGKSTVVYPLTLARGYYPENCILKNDGTLVKKK